MNKPFFRPTIGQRVTGWPVDSWNAICDFVSQPREAILTPNRRVQIAKPIEVMILNSSGGHIARGGVLKLNGLAAGPGTDESVFLKSPVLDGIAPTSAEDSVVICQTPIASTGVRPAIIQGPAWAKIDVTDAGHQYAVPASADTEKLASASAGYPIIWRETGTGTKTGLINLIQGAIGGAGSLLGVFTATTTFSTNNFADGFIRTCNSSSSEYDIGSHGISFDTDHWQTSTAGVYYIEADVEYDPPNPALGTLCNPAETSPTAIVCRMTSADIELTGTPLYGEFQQRREFYNFIEHGGRSENLHLHPFGIANISSAGTVQLKIWADDHPGSVATTWPVISAHITFVRLNDEWST